MSVSSSRLNTYVRQYTEFRVQSLVHKDGYDYPVSSGIIKIPYHIKANEGKVTPNQINSFLRPLCTDSTGNFNKTTSEIQEIANTNLKNCGVDCSGFVYYVLNEASYNKVMDFFKVSYAHGVSANNLSSSVNGSVLSLAKDIVPGATFRMDSGAHVAVVYDVVKNASGVVTRIRYAHSNPSHGPHIAYIDIGDQNKNLKDAAQTWYDSAYTDRTAKSLFNHAILLSCLNG